MRGLSWSMESTQEAAWGRGFDLSLEGDAGRAVERVSAWDKGQGQYWGGSQHSGLAGRTGPGGSGRPPDPTVKGWTMDSR